MKRGVSSLLMAMLIFPLIAACESLGERAKGLSRPTYSDYKNAKQPSPDEVDRLMTECPKPVGVFLNDAEEKGDSFG
ncbi:MAG: hypothetical protein IPO00_03390 [Betaproteobacteria bacterium]|nr:hypothetical protein [Betaproteobacteria bacterium]